VNCLVTGATGALGLNLVHLLVNRGQCPRVLVRASSDRSWLPAGPVEFCLGDVRDVESLRCAAKDCEAIYHLAARVEISPWGLPEAREINVGGTRNVLRVARELGIRRVVHTSSIATIAAGTLSEPADESVPYNLHDVGIPYYTTKREAEEVVSRAVDSGVDAVIANPTYLIGPLDPKPSSGRVVLKIARRRLPFYPTCGGINFVDTRIAAQGLILAMERGHTGERYILGGENLSYAAFSERVARIAGVRPPRLGVGRVPATLAGRLGTVAGRLLPHAFRDFNHSIIQSSYLEHYVRSDKARHQLGLPPSSVEPAIEAALEWFRRHGYLAPVRAS
jgi:dihydroflavonol-4-reductase